jgi:hypothetical protein
MALDIETVKNADKNAINLLAYVSLMSNKNIPERVVRPLLFSDMFAYQYGISVSTLRSYSLVDVSESNEGYILDMHSLVQLTVLERIMKDPQELRYRLNRVSQSLLNLIPRRDDQDIMSSMKDNEFLSLVPHVYAVAEEAVWISDDQVCNSLVDTACRTAYVLQHIDISVHLCQEKLKAVSTNSYQHVQAHFEMGKSYELMANPLSSQSHFIEAIRLIENSNTYDKRRLEPYYQHCEFIF